jgi:Na+/H+ antiporter NhaD/arsenite permease-like protein
MIVSDLIRSPRRLIVLMLAVVSPISGFIPNTPIVATLLPVLEGWCQRRRISPSRVMLPMAFAVVLGGTISPAPNRGCAGRRGLFPRSGS